MPDAVTKKESSKAEKKFSKEFIERHQKMMETVKKNGLTREKSIGESIWMDQNPGKEFSGQLNICSATDKRTFQEELECVSVGTYRVAQKKLKDTYSLSIKDFTIRYQQETIRFYCTPIPTDVTEVTVGLVITSSEGEAMKVRDIKGRPSNEVLVAPLPFKKSESWNNHENVRFCKIFCSVLAANLRVDFRKFWGISLGVLCDDLFRALTPPWLTGVSFLRCTKFPTDLFTFNHVPIYISYEKDTEEGTNRANAKTTKYVLDKLKQFAPSEYRYELKNATEAEEKSNKDLFDALSWHQEKIDSDIEILAKGGPGAETKHPFYHRNLYREYSESNSSNWIGNFYVLDNLTKNSSVIMENKLNSSTNTTEIDITVFGIRRFFFILCSSDVCTPQASSKIIYVRNKMVIRINGQEKYSGVLQNSYYALRDSAGAHGHPYVIGVMKVLCKVLEDDTVKFTIEKN